MPIDIQKTLGCDNLSQAYRDAYNKMQPLLMDDDAIKQMSVMDLSALALYLGKFAEQEINSSIVQMMRQICGIEMPKHYCKFCRDRYIFADLKTSNSRVVRLNELRAKPGEYSDELKTIPIGDAYYALVALKERECLSEDKDFVGRYKWLFERRFLDTWRRIGTYRNQAAHTGVIFTREALEENINLFSIFMEYMPKMVELKRELTPEGYVDKIISEDTHIETIKDVKLTIEPDKPRAPKEVAQRYLYLEKLCKKHVTKSAQDELNQIIDNYSFDTTIFVDKNGKEGMRDVLGNVIIPARYDSLAYVFNSINCCLYSIIAKREGKFCLVRTDGSGEELTPPIYDMIDILPKFRGYLFKKEGSVAWGYMTNGGKEMTDCIIDGYQYGASLYFKSGDYWGVWQFGHFAASMIFDNIEMIDTDEPLLFTLNGIVGYVGIDDGIFVPKSEVDAIEDEDDRYDIMHGFVCDQYEDGVWI